MTRFDWSNIRDEAHLAWHRIDAARVPRQIGILIDTHLINEAVTKPTSSGKRPNENNSFSIQLGSLPQLYSPYPQKMIGHSIIEVYRCAQYPSHSPGDQGMIHIQARFSFFIHGCVQGMGRPPHHHTTAESAFFGSGFVCVSWKCICNAKM